MPTEPVLFTRLRRACARSPLVVAHRGESCRYPENTLPAFRSAVRLHADMIEFDVMQSREGRFFCFHDDTLDRTTDARSRLRRTGVRAAGAPWATLARLDAGQWKSRHFAGTTIPTLEDALRVIQRGSVVMIEHKHGSPRDLLALLRRLDLVDDVLVQSFDWAFVAAIHALEPRLPTGVLGEGPLTARHLRVLPRTGAHLVHWHWPDLRLLDVAHLHARGHLVCVYTADPELVLLGCSAAGVDAITTNDPARMRALVRAGALRRRRP